MQAEWTTSLRMDFLVVLVASDLKMQEHIPLKTSALQNLKKMAEHFCVTESAGRWPLKFS